MNICEGGYVLPGGGAPCVICGATVKGPCKRPGEIERLRRVEQQHERLKKAAKKLIEDFSGNDTLSAMVWDIKEALGGKRKSI